MKEEIKRNEKGQFARGIKTFGRPKGSKNKVTFAVKEKFQQLVDAYSLDQMKTDLMALKPVDRLRVMTDLLDFFIPKLNRTDHGMSLGDETIIIQLPTPPLIPPKGGVVELVSEIEGVLITETESEGLPLTPSTPLPPASPLDPSTTLRRGERGI